VRIPKPRRLLAALSDERLVDEVRHGSAAAFELLYDRHSGGILAFCRHMLRSADDAEDAVQHTFIAAHADIGRRGARDLHVKAWLYTIARNRCLSMLRARREIPTDDGIEIVTDRLSDDVQQREDLRALVADVHKLPDDQREALVLAEVGDLAHDEIARVLGCEASKVKSLVFQARSALIDRRLGRETPCAEIREQIATLRGGALRRSSLRHHLESCPGCSQYRDEVRRQRAMLAVALPVIPSAALKAHALGSLGLGGGSAALASAGAGGAGLAAQGGLAAKIGIAAVLAVGGGTAAVVHNGGVPLVHHSNPPAAHQASSTNGHPASLRAHTAGGRSTESAGTTSGKAGTTTARHHHHASKTSHRSDSGTQHGFTPTTGGSNGAAARQFAQTRGQGKHTGITKTHTTGQANQQAAHGHVRRPAPAHAKPAPKPHPAPVPTTKTVPAPQSGSTEATPAPTGTITTPAPATSPPGKSVAGDGAASSG